MIISKVTTGKKVKQRILRVCLHVYVCLISFHLYFPFIRHSMVDLIYYLIDTLLMPFMKEEDD